MTSSMPEFTGYAIEHERHAEIISYGLPIYHEFRKSFDSYPWEPPPEIDPREWYDIHNQGSVGSCQGQSLADSGEWLHVIAKGTEIQLSRGFAYLASQEFDGIRGDLGSTLSGGTRAAARGLPLEASFDYTADYSDLSRRYRSQRDQLLAGDIYRFPGAAPLSSAEDCYRWLSGWLGTIQIGIAWGLPDAWEITRYTPGRGGHAVVIPGYLKVSGWPMGIGFLLKNSWGTSWGRNGWALVHPNAIDDMIRSRSNVFVARSDMMAPRPRRERIDHYHLAMGL